MQQFGKEHLIHFLEEFISHQNHLMASGRFTQEYFEAIKLLAMLNGYIKVDVRKC